MSRVSVRVIVAMLICVVFCGSGCAQLTGDLKIRFKLRGDIPKSDPINVTLDKHTCGKTELINRELIVHPTNKGIQDVVVHVFTGRRGSKLPEQSAQFTDHTIEIKNCNFHPHVLISQAGDTITVVNNDPVGHNANISFLRNAVPTYTLPRGEPQQIEVAKAEPAVVPVVCNIHPWMKSHVLVVDHPFAAKSDENGDLIIKNLPVGELIFRAWHEVGSFKDEIYVNGVPTRWSANKFNVHIKKGMNDFGTVEIPVSELRKKGTGK